ncbi:hypothetical protein C1T31_12675 [Hanstruepera neustonica]|uniref:Uncharacterized protein n=1 Tax=Hanstruepera neustonica TaxID=1445657 RepID=A0A2K1DVV4_9FLAO|nr:DUF6090 family protein [Hanstruepera neustonica]PNQ72175.1 hypothetical protein C1T31_12675 [Hanstruepera neustonica]
MIKFFRNIRKSLLSEGKTGKYLKYAVGEIILVVIGILIALQINNWNEERKADLQEKQLLFNLKGEFEDNIKDLDSIALEVDEVIGSLEKLFGKFSPETTNYSLDSLNIWLSDALESPNWKPSEYLLNNLNNSGGIAELNNPQLKLLLYKWSRQTKEMQEVQQRTEQTGEEIIAYLKQHGSLRNVDVSDDEFNYTPSTILKSNAALLSDSWFENHIDDKLYMYVMTRKWLKRARKTLVELIEETKT